MKVAILTPAEWPILRAARLRALEDSPEAFLSDYHKEKNWGREEWVQRFNNAVWVIAQQGDDAIGVARSVLLPHRPPSERYVESVWVAPAHRGSGLTKTLLKALVDAEPTAGVTEIWLWLLDSNDQARRTYKNLGFMPTGFTQLLQDGSGRREERWYLTLDGGTALS